MVHHHIYRTIKWCTINGALLEVGWAGHDVSAMERAGCYAPGGRYPLPSTVLMTAIPAKVPTRFCLLGGGADVASAKVTQII